MYSHTCPRHLKLVNKQYKTPLIYKVNYGMCDVTLKVKYRSPILRQRKNTKIPQPPKVTCSCPENNIYTQLYWNSFTTYKTTCIHLLSLSCAPHMPGRFFPHHFFFALLIHMQEFFLNLILIETFSICFQMPLNNLEFSFYQALITLYCIICTAYFCPWEL